MTVFRNSRDAFSSARREQKPSPQPTAVPKVAVEAKTIAEAEPKAVVIPSEEPKWAKNKTNGHHDLMQGDKLLASIFKDEDGDWRFQLEGSGPDKERAGHWRKARKAAEKALEV